MDRSEEQLIAEALGVPAAAKEVGRLLYTGAPIERGLLKQAAAAKGIPIEPLLMFEGQPGRQFYTEAICGGLLFKLSGEVGTHQTAAPLAFQSTMAGVMLASDLVAHAGKLRAIPPPVSTRIDLLRPLDGPFAVRDALGSRSRDAASAKIQTTLLATKPNMGRPESEPTQHQLKSFENERLSGVFSKIRSDASMLDLRQHHFLLHAVSQTVVFVTSPEIPPNLGKCAQPRVTKPVTKSMYHSLTNFMSFDTIKRIWHKLRNSAGTPKNRSRNS